MFTPIRSRIEAAAPLPSLGIVRIADALGDRTGVDVTEEDLPAFLPVIDGSAAGEFGHGRSLVRLAAVRRDGSALQDSRLLNNARKIRNGLFVDGRRFRLSRLPDFRQVSSGQDRAEAGCYGLSKRRRERLANRPIGSAWNASEPLRIARRRIV